MNKLALLLFTAALYGAPPSFNVLDYGAKNDGSANATAAIRSAIQACAKAGGGTVYFPPGTYDTGAIQLVSNLVLNIDAGATLRFHTDLADYPIVKSRYEGTEALTPAPLIGGREPGERHHYRAGNPDHRQRRVDQEDQQSRCEGRLGDHPGAPGKG